jgi:hypothetical protein
MAPDVPTYLPGEPRWSTHALAGIVTIDVLLGLLLWAVWHGLLSAPAVAAAPHALRGRLTDVPLGLVRRLRSARALLLVVAALVVGAALHVGWDELTHPRRFGPEHVPALYDTYLGMRGYHWFQYASGLLGAGALVAWVVAWWRRTPALPAPAPDHRAPWAWGGLVVLTLIAAASGLLAEERLQDAARTAAIRGGGVAVVVAVLLAAGWQLRPTAASRPS